MTGAPAISVILPARDQGTYTGASVRSVLDQRDADFELVICDDGSREPLAPFVASLGDERVRLVRHEQAQGAPAARNRCLSIARGRYVAFLDADDVLLPGALARQADVLEHMPGVALVHGGFEVIDERGERLPDWEQLSTEDTVVPGAEAFAELILADFITNSTVMTRRSALDSAGPFATDMGPSSTDWEMWMRVVLRGDVAYLAAPVAQYRQHQATISATTIRNGQRLRSDVRAIERIFRLQRHRIAHIDRNRARARAALVVKAVVAAGDAATRNDRWAAVRALVVGMKADPCLAREPAVWALVAAHARGDGYRSYRAGKAVVALRLGQLDGTRFSRRFEKMGRDDSEWQAQLERAAAAVRSHVPRAATVAVIDKWDPTVLHLAGRKGVHFPDRSLLPAGYPTGSDEAIDHLETLRARGVDHLAVPAGSAWWLDHYDEFRNHLDGRYVKVHGGPDCVIYSLRVPA